LQEPVLITENTWRGHVVRRHPEMGPFLDLVVATIRAPEVITRHSGRRGRLYFFRDWRASPGFPAKWLQTVIRLKTDDSPAVLLSAWPSRELYGEDVIWIRQMRL